MKTNFLQIGFLFFISLSVMGAKIGDNEVLLGKKGSSGNKKIIFDTGDGSLNKAFTLQHASKAMTLSSNVFQLGDASNAVNKRIIFDRGGANPEIRWNESGSALEFSNNGTSFSGIGSGGGGASAKNYVENAAFRFNQRKSFTNLAGGVDDAGYGLDEWKMYNSGGAGVFASSAVINEDISGSPNETIGLFRQFDSTSRQFGIIQCIPKNKVIDLRGQQVQFSQYLRTDGSEITTLRMGIVEWTGAEDAPTSDLVSSWAVTPTLVASAAFLNTPADITITSTMVQHTVTASVGASMNNLCVFTWTPGAEAQNDDFYAGQAQLTTGATAASWISIKKSFNDDLADVQKFLITTWGVDEGYDTQTTFPFQQKYINPSNNNVYFAPFVYPQAMFNKTPNCATYSTSGSALANVYRDGSGGGTERTGACTGGQTMALASTSVAPLSQDAIIAVQYVLEAVWF